MHIHARSPEAVVTALSHLRARAARWGGAGAVISGMPVIVDEGRTWVNGLELSDVEANIALTGSRSGLFTVDCI